jgi:hypothetical protein
MTGTLDDRYLTWLYEQIGSVTLKTPARTYWILLRQLYSKEFVWFVPNDDNRVEDGRELRHEFVSSQNITDADSEWMGLGCSMLEMLIGLSRRLSFEAGGEPRVWFWHFMDILDLRKCNDRSRFSEKYVDNILSIVIWRNYNSDGQGGLFPLRNPQQDQRKVEIWYQMSAYLLEHY